MNSQPHVSSGLGVQGFSSEPYLHCQSYTCGFTSASCTSTLPKLISVFHTSISTCSLEPGWLPCKGLRYPTSSCGSDPHP